MAIQIIKNSASANGLESWGPVKTPISEPACELQGLRVAIPGLESTRTGIWECSPGTYRRDVKEGEVMHFLAGEATFTPDDGEPIQIAAGDTVFCSPLTGGVWEVKATLRKVFVIVS